MKQLLALHGRALKHGFQQLIQQPIGNLLALFLLGMAIALPLCLYLLLSSAQQWGQHAQVTPELSVFLKMNAERSDIAVLDEALRKMDQLADYRFIGKDEALDDLLERQALGDLKQALDKNPLPDAFVLVPHPMPLLHMEALAQQLRELPAVDAVHFDTGWAQKLGQAVVLLEHFTWIMSLAFAIGLVLMTHNIIRMQILAKRDEIEVSRLIGAPNAFILRPFLYLALWQGLIATMIGIALSFAFIHSMNPLLAQFSELYQAHFVIEPLSFSGSYTLLFFVVVLTSVAAILASTHILKRLDDAHSAL